MADPGIQLAVGFRKRLNRPARISLSHQDLAFDQLAICLWFIQQFLREIGGDFLREGGLAGGSESAAGEETDFHRLAIRE